MDSSNQPAGKLPDPLPRGGDRGIPRSTTRTLRSGNRDPSPHITGSWGLGREHSLQTRTGTSALGRTAGRGLFVLGVGLTYSSEAEKADTRYREQNPELSASERQSRVRETATVRTGSQVLASAWAGAAVGSMLPVGGTAVGLTVGVVVGLGMSIDTGEGKTVGDRIADVGEGFWNWCKGVFGR